MIRPDRSRPDRSRDETLAVLRGQPIPRLPVFSGLPSVTSAGLHAAGIRYSEAHTDPAKMALAAASTYALCGFESAVVPFDLCIEAEALGGGVDFHTDVDLFLPPVVASPLSHLPRTAPEDVSRAGRIPLVGEARTAYRHRRMDTGTLYVGMASSGIRRVVRRYERARASRAFIEHARQFPSSGGGFLSPCGS
jgi:uroporphyrinogen-III decarboxylase